MHSKCIFELRVKKKSKHKNLPFALIAELSINSKQDLMTQLDLGAMDWNE